MPTAIPTNAAPRAAVSTVVPTLLVLVVGFGLFLAQPSALGVTGLPGLGIVLLVVFPLLFGWIIGLGAVGGSPEGYLWSTSRSPSGETASR